jgi:hypothetical protein
MGKIIIIILNIALTNFDELQQYNFIWSFVFLVIFCIFIVYILLSSFMFIYIDSYRQVVLAEGHYNTKEQKESTNRKHITFLRWLLGWLPTST